MMTAAEKAIRYFEEQRVSLQEHVKRGGEFAKDALEATEEALKALKKQVPRALRDNRCPTCDLYNDDGDSICCSCGQALDPELTGCIAMECIECAENSEKSVCPFYADKVDEIRRIHEEG